MDITQHPRFRWMAGMLTTTGRRVLDVHLRYGDEPDSVEIVSVRTDGGTYLPISALSVGQFVREHGHLDLTDPATVGCLYAMLMQDIHGRGVVTLGRYHVSTWSPVDARESQFKGSCLGESVALALLDAWLPKAIVRAEVVS